LEKRFLSLVLKNQLVQVRLLIHNQLVQVR